MFALGSTHERCTVIFERCQKKLKRSMTLCRQPLCFTRNQAFGKSLRNTWYRDIDCCQPCKIHLQGSVRVGPRPNLDRQRDILTHSTDYFSTSDLRRDPRSVEPSSCVWILFTYFHDDITRIKNKQVEICCKKYLYSSGNTDRTPMEA